MTMMMMVDVVMMMVDVVVTMMMVVDVVMMVDVVFMMMVNTLFAWQTVASEFATNHGVVTLG